MTFIDGCLALGILIALAPEHGGGTVVGRPCRSLSSRASAAAKRFANWHEARSS